MQARTLSEAMIFPELPDVSLDQTTTPDRIILRSTEGFYLVSLDFDNPTGGHFRKYKRLGWAARYIGIAKEKLLKLFENPINL